MTSYDYGYGMDSALDTTLSSPGLSALFIGTIIFSLILSLIMIISYWKIFVRKGKPGWAILIPIYNIIVQIQAAELSMVYFVLLLIPFVNIYAIFKINISLAKSFDKTTAFGVGMVFLPVIFVPLLAFSDSEEKKVVSKNEDFNAMNVINNESNNVLSESNNIPTIENVEISPVDVSNVNDATNNTVDNNTLDKGIEENNTLDSNVGLNIEPNAIQVEPVNISTPIETVDNEANKVEMSDMVSNEANLSNDINNNLETNNTILENNNVDVAVNNSLETPVPNSETLNAFNTKPILENNEVETEVLNIPQANNNEVENNVNNNVEIPVMNDTKKYCKSCGKEMPGIVSICPNCGTDNE